MSFFSSKTYSIEYKIIKPDHHIQLMFLPQRCISLDPSSITYNLCLKLNLQYSKRVCVHVMTRDILNSLLLLWGIKCKAIMKFLLDLFLDGKYCDTTGNHLSCHVSCYHDDIEIPTSLIANNRPLSIWGVSNFSCT